MEARDALDNYVKILLILGLSGGLSTDGRHLHETEDGAEVGAAIEVGAAQVGVALEHGREHAQRLGKQRHAAPVRCKTMIVYGMSGSVREGTFFFTLQPTVCSGGRGERGAGMRGAPVMRMHRRRT